MSVTSWNPPGTAANIFTPPTELLQRFIALGNSPDRSDLTQAFSPEQQAEYAPAILLDIKQWQALIENLPNEAIVALIRFFTLAEEQLPGWEALDKSAVIPLNKLLRQRGGRLQQDVLIWIRQNSRNRYLPNGAIL